MEHILSKKNDRKTYKTFYLTKKDMIYIAGSSMVLCFLALTGFWFFGDRVLGPVIVLATMILSVTILESYRRLREIHAQNYRQIEALFSLYATLKPGAPLPESRGWAASPDLLKKLSEIILQQQPALVVEIGSGVSTLIMAYSLKHIGNGTLLAIEEDAQLASNLRKRIALHGLEEYVTVLHCPLKTISLNGESWSWYDLSGIRFGEPIQMLIIDGPAASESRYPALPILFHDLCEEAIIIADDGKLASMQHIARRWKQEFPGLTSAYIPLEKGCLLFGKNGQIPPECTTTNFWP